MRNGPVFATILALASTTPTLGQVRHPLLGLRAELRPISHQVPVGQPVWVRFSIANTSPEAVTLTVPDTEPAIPSPEAGLPLSHVFSGGSSSGVTITTESNRRWDQPTGHHTRSEAPILMISAYGSVGRTLDLREYFPVLRGAGLYRVEWAPYGGAIASETVVLTVAPLQRAEILTDHGAMTLRFLYSEAPAHVANFIELVKSEFYTGKTFHRLVPGYFLQGGCPRGDGTGIRTDGKRLRAEFNGHPMHKGAVAMALLDDDPDSASSQFFICNTRQREWDGRYTVFAELVGEESFATLDRLMAAEVGEDGRPVQPLYMRSVRIVAAPPDTPP